MVSIDPQRGEPDLSKSGQTNFIYEGYLKIPLDFLSKDEALTIINVLLNKVSSIEQNQADTREHPIRGDANTVDSRITVVKHVGSYIQS